MNIGLSRSQFKVFRRWMYPGAIALLVALCFFLYSIILGYREHQSTLTAENAELTEQLSASPDQVFNLNRQQQQFLLSTAQQLNYPVEQRNDITAKDMAQILGHAHVQFNKTQPVWEPSAYYSMLSDVRSQTVEQRDVTFTTHLTPSLNAESVEIELPESVELYKYELTNTSDRPQTAPILYQTYRWDSTEALVESAGFRDIENETDRAIALWEFLSRNRYHFYPVTEAIEEHDVIKFLSLYGYGFCDDSARTLATLANQAGLRARIWEISGHVIPDIFADGRWIMLDPDYQVYFHKSDDERYIYGSDELDENQAFFSVYQSLTGQETFSTVIDKYAGYFLSKEDNTVQEGENYRSVTATANHEISLNLLPSQSITFTNYNWGHYFQGGYPQRVPKYFNGYYHSPFVVESIANSSDTIEIETTEQGIKFINNSAQRGRVRWNYQSEFPLVGGLVSGNIVSQEGDVSLRLDDRDNELRVEYPLQAGEAAIDISSFFSVMAPHPTFNYSSTLILEPGASIELGQDFTTISDFQFADLALLKLESGDNQVQVYAEHPELLDQIRLNVYVQ